MVPQGSVLGRLLFLAYINDIWRNIESNIRLFADDCIIYRKITDSRDIEKLQKDLNSLGEWAAENEMKINPDKSKAVSLVVSKPVCRLRPPEVTSRSRDVNKDGGGVNDLPPPLPPN